MTKASGITGAVGVAARRNPEASRAVGEILVVLPWEATRSVSRLEMISNVQEKLMREAASAQWKGDGE